MYIIYTHTRIHMSRDRTLTIQEYGVATISRLLKIKGLFCKRALYKRLCVCVCVCMYVCVCV